MARIVKSLKANFHPHREHRSKKGRSRHFLVKKVVGRYKKKKEELEVKDKLLW